MEAIQLVKNTKGQTTGLFINFDSIKSLSVEASKTKF